MPHECRHAFPPVFSLQAKDRLCHRLGVPIGEGPYLTVLVGIDLFRENHGDVLLPRSNLKIRDLPRERPDRSLPVLFKTQAIQHRDRVNNDEAYAFYRNRVLDHLFLFLKRRGAEEENIAQDSFVITVHTDLPHPFNGDALGVNVRDFLPPAHAFSCRLKAQIGLP